MADIKPRLLSKEEKQYFLDLKHENITIETFEDLFTHTLDKGKVVGPKFNTYDIIELEAKEYMNSTKITTNCGLFMFNKYVVEPAGLNDKLGYINFELSKKGLGTLMGMMDNLLLEDKIKPDDEYARFLDRLAHISFTFNTQISSSMTLNTLKPIPDVDKRKKELFKENAEAIKNVDLPTITAIEKELVELAKVKKKDDVDMELYTSGARGAFENSYKNAMIMKGPVYNSAKKEWECVENSLLQGANKSDIPVLANSVIASTYPKAISTGECGYQAKQLTAAFQGVTIGPKGSNCGSKKTDKILLTNDNKDLYLYRYIVEGGKFICLDKNTLSKYIGKEVNMRSLLYCTSDHICNICAGELFYKLGITNIGLTTSRVANSMLNARMKAFHDSTVKTQTLEPKDIFL